MVLRTIRLAPVFQPWYWEVNLGMESKMKHAPMATLIRLHKGKSANKQSCIIMIHNGMMYLSPGPGTFAKVLYFDILRLPVLEVHKIIYTLIHTFAWLDPFGFFIPEQFAERLPRVDRSNAKAPKCPKATSWFHHISWHWNEMFESEYPWRILKDPINRWFTAKSSLYNLQYLWAQRQANKMRITIIRTVLGILGRRLSGPSKLTWSDFKSIKSLQISKPERVNRVNRKLAKCRGSPSPISLIVSLCKQSFRHWYAMTMPGRALLHTNPKGSYWSMKTASQGSGQWRESTIFFATVLSPASCLALRSA